MIIKNIILFFMIIYSLYAEIEKISPYSSLREIKTKHFNVIYPKSFEKNANYYANMLEKILEQITKLFPKSKMPSKSRWPILINTFNITENGYVTYATKHSQLYFSISSTSPENWLKRLAIHELTHILQNEMGKKNFLLAILYLFGQQSYNNAFNTALGNKWILEGQAVSTETLLSNYGRGKDPRFDMSLKALLLENKLKSFPDYFDILSNSSWGLYPNFYVYGYFLSLYIEKKYSLNIWKKLYNEASYFPVFSFTAGIQKLTGRSIYNIYKDMLKDLKDTYLDQLNKTDITYFNSITPTIKKRRTDYINPIIYNNKVLALQTNYRNLLSRTQSQKNLILIDPKTNKSQILTNIKSGQNPHVSRGNKLITWSVLESSHRWSSTTYKNIYTFNLKTKKKKKLTQKTRFFFPTISQNDETIAAVEIKYLDHSYIKLIDAINGKTIKTYFQDEQDHFFDLKFYGNNKLVYIRHVKKTDKNQIEILDLENDTVKVILSNHDINGKPFLTKGFVFYHSNYSGITNIYAYNIKTQKHYQVTSSKYGSFYPHANENNVYFSTYKNKHGISIDSTTIDPKSWILKRNATIAKISYYKHFDKKKILKITDFKEENFIQYKSQKHYKASTFFIRSFILSGNSLTRLNSNFKFTDIYNIFKWNIFSSILFHNNYKYKGYTVGTELKTSLTYLNIATKLEYQDKNIPFENILDIQSNSIINTIDIDLPLYFYFDNFTYTLLPKVINVIQYNIYNHPFSIRKNQNETISSKKIGENTYSNIYFKQHYILYQRFIMPSYKIDFINIYSQSLQYLDIHSHSHSINNTINGFYGIDLLKIYIQYGSSNSKSILPLSIENVGGYNESTHKKKLFLGISYALPIISRGHLGPILNFENFTIKPFYRVGFIFKTTLSNEYHAIRSVGIDFTFNFKILNTLPFFVGVQYIYAIDNIAQKNSVNPVFGFTEIF